MDGIEALISKNLEETRKKNIAENKAFLAKIMADIKQSGLNLTEKKGRVSTAKKPRRPSTPRVIRQEEGARRPVTRQRRKEIIKDGDETAEDPLSAPPSPVDENNNLTVKLKFGRKRRREVRPAEEGSPKKRKIDMEDVNLDEISYKCSEKIYDKYNGTTCHQCRQKTIDQKTICKSESCLSVRGQFCGVCLKNRYGEDAREALLDENWTCPPCRGICNCSICRNREGFCATGILIHLANARGFPDVNSYLQSLNSDGEDDDDDGEEEEESDDEDEKENKIKEEESDDEDDKENKIKEEGKENKVVKEENEREVQKEEKEKKIMKEKNESEIEKEETERKIKKEETENKVKQEENECPIKKEENKSENKKEETENKVKNEKNRSGRRANKKKKSEVKVEAEDEM